MPTLVDTLHPPLAMALMPAARFAPLRDRRVIETRSVAGLAVAFALLLVACSPPHARTAGEPIIPPRASASAHPGWEYFCAERPEQSGAEAHEAFLNRAGEQGWELAHASGSRWCFKRPSAGPPARSEPSEVIAELTAAGANAALHALVTAIEQRDREALLGLVDPGEDSIEEVGDRIVEEFFDKDREDILSCLRGVRVVSIEPIPDVAGRYKVNIEGCPGRSSGTMSYTAGRWRIAGF